MSDRAIELRPVIASYSGEAYRAIQGYLSRRVLNLIARAAVSPGDVAGFDPQTCAELIEMHVLKEADGRFQLDTAVFLEEDLWVINRFAASFAKDLAGRVAEAAAPMQSELPAITNFVVGILGIVQSLGQAVRKAGISVDWPNYRGRYARSKVDFEQICAASAAAGPDLLNKTILRGWRYTAVFTGPGGETFPIRLPWENHAQGQMELIRRTNEFMIDAYAMLLTGQIEHPALRSAAERAGLIRDGKSQTAVLTKESFGIHLPVLANVRRITCEYYYDKLGAMNDLLQSTTSGKAGVPIANMNLHLWRYLRRAVARELYAAGVFTDLIPETGAITIFYQNDVEVIHELLH